MGAQGGVATPDDKYDRQLRIWGAQGQSDLERASVCLLGCSATGTETLKNLVLGGIQGFTAVDGGLVCARDTGSNFFLSSSDVGRPRAVAVTARLVALNRSVQGTAVEEDPRVLVATRPETLRAFDLVVINGFEGSFAARVASVCAELGIKYVWVRSYGMVGYLRLGGGAHYVLQTAADQAADDLRLGRPWPDLREHCAELQGIAEGGDAGLARHVPFLALLNTLWAEWVAGEGAEEVGAMVAARPPAGSFRGSAAGSRAAKASFKEYVKAAAPRFGDGDNAAEAAANAHKVFSSFAVPPALADLLEGVDPAARPEGGERADIWAILCALKQYVAEESAACALGECLLPVTGQLPDMTSTTELYVRLQECYTRKSESDVARVTEKAMALFRGSEPSEEVEPRKFEDAVRRMCMHARSLQRIVFPDLAREIVWDTESPGPSPTVKADPGGTEMAVYVLFKACDRYFDANNRFPGEFDSPEDSALDEDEARLRTLVGQTAASLGANKNCVVMDDYVSEFLRCGGGELHSTAAFMGGVASQEIIKLITSQFVPVADTLIYDGLANKLTSLELIVPSMSP